MQVNLFSHCDDSQINRLKRFQQSFCPRRGRGSFGIPRIQPSQFRSHFGQFTPNDELQQSQHAQANRQQADQPRHALIILQIHGCQRQRSAFQARKASFHQIFLPVSQNRFRQGQALFCMVRPIHAPAEMSDSLRNGSFILADRDGHFSFDAHFRRALTLAPGRSTTFAALAWMELQASRFESACVLSNASIAAWPYDPLPYAVRAESRLRLADARDAYSDAELVRRLATGAWPEALRVLISNGASNVDEARQQIMALTAAWLAPGTQFSVRDAEYLALAYLAMGDQRRAIESLRRARPMGADLRVALRSPRLAAIRTDTAVVRMLAESESPNRE